jgi:hypothetical protein
MARTYIVLLGHSIMLPYSVSHVLCNQQQQNRGRQQQQQHAAAKWSSSQLELADAAADCRS